MTLTVDPPHSSRAMTPAEARAALTSEWVRRAPSSPEEIAAFYRDSECLGGDLDAFHSFPERQRWTDALVHVATNLSAEQPGVSVVDIGSGGGHDLRALRDAGIRKVVGVEPNDGLRDACFSDGFTMSSDVTLAPIESADVLSCFDVLEHIPNPEAFLNAIARRAQLGAILLETTATHDLDTPLHLAANVGWHPGHALRGAGWECIDESGRMRVWKRFYSERMTATHVMVCSDRAVSGETFDSFIRLVMTNTPEFNWRPGRAHESGLLRARNIWLSNWYRTTADEVCIMFDSDVQFLPHVAESLVRLAREKRGIAVAAYSTRDAGHPAIRSDEGLTEFGPGALPRAIRWGSTGAMAIHRDVCEAIVPTLPLIHPNSEHCYWPMFAFNVVEDEAAGGCNELSEDWEFCRRAQELGFEVWLDPSLKVTHWGMQPITLGNMDLIREARRVAMEGAI